MKVFFKICFTLLLVLLGISYGYKYYQIQAMENSQHYLPVIATSWDGQIRLRQVATDIVRPTSIVSKAGDLYISENNGIITNVSTGNTFLDIRDRVDHTIYGFTFHEDHVYVWYRTFTQIVISRFVFIGETADADSEEVIIAWETFPDGIHNAGDLHFGADGYLYIVAGDGGPLFDENMRAQDRTLFFGKILRLDVSSNSSGLSPECDPDGNYKIPLDNPFVSANNENCNEIWAYGLRQPWRFSFDRETGDMWIGDVGLSQREEVNRQIVNSLGGQNYGWNCYEGSLPLMLSDCMDRGSNYEFPYFEYGHENGRCSIVGGYVYRGNEMPSLQGHYFFADYCSGEVMSLDVDGEMRVWLDVENVSWVTFGERDDGELYLADYSVGTIYKIGK